MKVQKRKIGNYQQLYITLPAKICQAMDIEKGTDILISVAGKDSLLLKVISKVIIIIMVGNNRRNIYMAHEERVKLYEKIEEKRGRPLISYFTNLRANASAQMASDVIPEFAKQILEIPKEQKEVDILIVSYGGDPTVAWRIISMLRERFEKVSVLVPYAAYSAATLLALGANEILMHPFSNLGPVDPQLAYKDKEGKIQQFGYEDLRLYLDFVKGDVGISDQEQLERAFELVCKDIGSIPIGVAKRSSYLALSMGEKLLSLHMKDQNKVKAIAEALNKSFYYHGYPVGRKEAKKVGLPVKNPDEELENLMWLVWNDVEEEMECNKPFDPLGIVLSDEKTAKLIGNVPQVQMPINLPPQILQQAINDILNKIEVIQVEPIDYELISASIESTRCISEFKVKGKISAARLPDMNIAVNVVKTESGWRFHKIKKEE
ncbi:serine dehydrogenase proteinase [archaeon BMS3Bbin15]|nr:serine dehydrogenase proteinase [archaeon BMS3Bbin15]